MPLGVTCVLVCNAVAIGDIDLTSQQWVGVQSRILTMFSVT